MSRRTVLLVAAWVVPFLLLLVRAFLPIDRGAGMLLLVPPEPFTHDPAVANGMGLFVGLLIGLTAVLLCEAGGRLIARDDDVALSLAAGLQFVLAIDFLAVTANKLLVAFPAWLVGNAVSRWEVVEAGGHIPWIGLLATIVVSLVASSRATTPQSNSLTQDSRRRTLSAAGLLLAAGAIPEFVYVFHRSTLPAAWIPNVFLSSYAQAPVLSGGALALGLVAATLAAFLAAAARVVSSPMSLPRWLRSAVLASPLLLFVATFASICRQWVACLPPWLTNSVPPRSLASMNPVAPWIGTLLASVLAAAVAGSLRYRARRA